MNARVPGHGELVIGSDLAMLSQIFEPAVQLACWQRPLPQAIADYLQTLAASNNLPLGQRGLLKDSEQPALDYWPAGPGREAMVAEIAWLASLLTTLLDCDGVSWRIEVLNKAMCPRFHIDRTGIRLVSTWLGPGTEWLAGEQLSRHKLGQGSGGLPDEASGLMDGQQVGQSQPGEVLLLKGSLWQGNAGKGAVHRSPQVAAGQPRVLLAMDGWWQ